MALKLPTTWFEDSVFAIPTSEIGCHLNRSYAGNAGKRGSISERTFAERGAPADLAPQRTKSEVNFKPLMLRVCDTGPINIQRTR